MNIIPCGGNQIASEADIDQIAEKLKTEAHTLGGHTLDEKEFYSSGLFRSAIERIRGQFSASMGEKREFVKHILNYMQDNNFIADWESAGASNRHDYEVILNNESVTAIELKGCLDGNNTTIFERPPNATEFVIWSICNNVGSNIQKNVWSGIHTRLGPDIIAGKQQVVDGLIVWDWICGSKDRPCPKIAFKPERITSVGPFSVPPPCLYIFPSTIPSPRNNPSPPARKVGDVQLMKAFFNCFQGETSEIHQVRYYVENRGSGMSRTTTINSDGEILRNSGPSPIRRS